VSPSTELQNELSSRQRKASLVVAGFFILSLALVALAYSVAVRWQRPGDPGVVMALWIAILVFGLGALVLRRTRFAAMRLKDIAALKGPSGLLKTLEGTTIQIACLGGAIALMGFAITIRTGDWLDMLRAAGVSLIVLAYGYPIKSSWQRAIVMLAPDMN
jgi:hypothetical protein